MEKAEEAKEIVRKEFERLGMVELSQIVSTDKSETLTPVLVYKHGVQLLDQNEVKKAFWWFKKGLEIKKDYHQALFRMGECMRRLKEYDIAIKLYALGIKLCQQKAKNPSDGEDINSSISWGLVERGVCNYHRGFYKLALNDFEVASKNRGQYRGDEEFGGLVKLIDKCNNKLKERELESVESEPQIKEHKPYGRDQSISLDQIMLMRKVKYEFQKGVYLTYIQVISRDITWLDIVLTNNMYAYLRDYKWIEESDFNRIKERHKKRESNIIRRYYHRLFPDKDKFIQKRCNFFGEGDTQLIEEIKEYALDSICTIYMDNEEYGFPKYEFSKKELIDIMQRRVNAIKSENLTKETIVNY